jgi:hypothetical protein
VLGPLPRMYRYIVSVIALAVFMAGGVWAAYAVPYPILLSAGAGVGLALGGLATFFLLHQPQQSRVSGVHARRHTWHDDLR